MVDFTYHSLYQRISAMLSYCTDCSDFETAQLFRHVLGLNKYQLEKDLPVDEKNAALLLQLAKRRLEGYPLQYLLGEWDFYGLTLRIGEGVLIPRADTETIVDTVLELAKANPPKTVADLCSGSGAIALALWDNLKSPVVPVIYAVELSEQAIPYLRENIADICGNNHAVRLICGDVLSELPLPMLDMVVSNPPYIPCDVLPSLAPEVQYEPRMALDGGKDGLHFYREIARCYYSKLNTGGAIVFEAGYDQGEAIMEILSSTGYHGVDYRKDIAGIKRAILGYR